YRLVVWQKCWVQTDVRRELALKVRFSSHQPEWRLQQQHRLGLHESHEELPKRVCRQQCAVHVYIQWSSSWSFERNEGVRYDRSFCLRVFAHHRSNRSSFHCAQSSARPCSPAVCPER